MPKKLNIKIPTPPTDQAGVEEIRKKLGRPTKYKHEYCQVVMELGAKGYSQAEIHAEIANGDKTQVDRWKNAHAEFRESMLRARELSLSWWEKTARENAGNRDFNSNLYRIAMLGRFSAEYRENKLLVETLPQSPADLSKLTVEEREQLAVLLRKAKPQEPATLPDPAAPQPLPSSGIKPAEPDEMAGNGHLH